MPQIFQVLRCYKCFVFQIHQTKKSNRWECKLCGEKQSIKRHYGIGNGKECRLHVQRLNGLRGEKDETKINESNADDDNESENEDIVDTDNLKKTQVKNKSKWSDYMEAHEEPQESDSTETMYLGEKEVVLEVPIKRKKNTKKNQNKISKDTILKTIDRNNTRKDDFKSNFICNETLKSVNFLLDKPRKCAADTCIAKTIIQKRDVSVSKIESPTINKNSKWAQYTNEKNSDGKNTSLSPTKATKQSTPKGLFSLCEDGDLDNVLDF